MLNACLMALGLATLGQAGPRWEVVTNRPGNFTVEMPAKPDHTGSSTSRGPNGRVDITEIVAETPEGTFVVSRVEDPVIIPKKLEQQYLDFTRDMFAAKYNGQVTSDKKVLLNASPGRDFAVDVPAPQGKIQIRAREYLQGKAVFVLLCVSRPGQDLPESAAHFLGSFAFGIHPEGTTVRADKRETEATGRNLAGWGMAIDPDKDVDFKVAGKALTLKIPGKLHDLTADSGNFNAPRVLREVSGDFVATVLVDGTFKPAAPSTKPKTYPLNTAGLLLWKDAENYIFILKTTILGKGNKINNAILFEEREAGHRGAVHNLTIPAGPIGLHLERQGTRIVGGVTTDGSTWKPLKPIDTTWAGGPVRVGLLSTNTSSEPSVVKFEAYKLDAK